MNNYSLRLNWFFAGCISWVLGLMILQLEYKALIFLGLVAFSLLFFIKTEYVFYFLLASRSMVDIFYRSEAAGSIRVTHFIGLLVVALFLFYLVTSGYDFFKVNVNKIYGILN